MTSLHGHVRCHGDDGGLVSLEVIWIVVSLTVVGRGEAQRAAALSFVRLPATAL